jgi:hypothetical protein
MSSDVPIVVDPKVPTGLAQLVDAVFPGRRPQPNVNFWDALNQTPIVFESQLAVPVMDHELLEHGCGGC